MTYCIPLALIIPAAPPAASIRDTAQAALTRPGWAEPGQDHAGRWLRNAAAGLCVLAAAAAAVSFTAQYRMAEAARHLPAIAVLEAAIPDAAPSPWPSCSSWRRSPHRRSCPPATCPATAPASCGSACTCGCPPASPTSSACGYAGAAWPRCAARAGSALPSCRPAHRAPSCRRRL